MYIQYQSYKGHFPKKNKKLSSKTVSIRNIAQQSPFPLHYRQTKRTGSTIIPLFQKLY